MHILRRMRKACSLPPLANKALLEDAVCWDEQLRSVPEDELEAAYVEAGETHEGQHALSAFELRQAHKRRVAAGLVKAKPVVLIQAGPELPLATPLEVLNGILSGEIQPPEGVTREEYALALRTVAAFRNDLSAGADTPTRATTTIADVVKLDRSA